MTKDKKINFRLTDELLEKLCKSAANNKRSLSSEIFYRLLQSFKKGTAK